MYKIIILLCMVINIFANDLVDLYRLKGLGAVENQLEQQLQQKDYWNEYLQDKDVSLGYYETKKFVILTEKENAELSLFKIDNHMTNLVSRNTVITGEREGDKYLEGDKKTPEGAYELLNKKDQLDQFYGPFALVTSYPNTFDRTLNKKGHGIWIHGMPLKDEERENYTRGCIALENNQLEELEKEINLSDAVLLTSHKALVKAEKEDIALILSTIYSWKDSWKKSHINSYLKHYSKNFIKNDGSDFKTFSRVKKIIFSRNERKRIKLYNINISPYPNSLEKRMYKVIMDEKYSSPAVKFNGKKELFF